MFLREGAKLLLVQWIIRGMYDARCHSVPSFDKRICSIKPTESWKKRPQLERLLQISQRDNNYKEVRQVYPLPKAMDGSFVASQTDKEFLSLFQWLDVCIESSALSIAIEGGLNLRENYAITSVRGTISTLHIHIHNTRLSVSILFINSLLLDSLLFTRCQNSNLKL
ncbi:hypothetical protein BDF20DRAFT_986021 [Mycotypha africana]|uniref:uncharacterized protein n=1 Tax=Mycotypha africana TaxID=64632 RepID=UPI002300DEBA|nr:uncharacterized protein BDF20DRAFT_986021 [Mycotypha africana]KAI8984076.1 hypothetical protein BDF20DRAFT_986021 [Mycotypha africana]